MRRYLLERIHVSWHIAAACLGVLVGAVALLKVPVSFFDGLVWLMVGAALFVTVLFSRLRIVLLASLLAGVMIGGWRGTIERKALQEYTPYYGSVLRLSGIVSEDAVHGKQGDQRLQLKDIRIDGHSFHGQVWASTSSGAAVKRGDTVFLRGTLNKGFGNLAASMYRTHLERVERHYPGDVGRRIRDWFADGVREGIAEPQASLGIGYLTGQRSTLPAELDEQLRIAGLTHAVVASGYNLTVLVGMTRKVFAGISKYLAALSGICLISGFVLVTGLSPSMSRAGLIAGLSLAAWYYGRTIHPFVLLPFAACITVLINPSYIWGDMGWCLSFAAFAGVLILAPLLRHYFWGEQNSFGITKQILTDTASAQLATLPIILGAFGQYAAYALPANILVLPLVPITMLLTFLAGCLSLSWPSMAVAAGFPASLLLRYMTEVVGCIAALPGAQEEISLDASAVIVCYSMLILLCVFLRNKTRHNFRE